MTERTDCTRFDWAGNLGTYGLIWGLPVVAIIVGLVIDVASRTAIWSVALLWMGIALSMLKTPKR